KVESQSSPSHLQFSSPSCNTSRLALQHTQHAALHMLPSFDVVNSLPGVAALSTLPCTPLARPFNLSHPSIAQPTSSSPTQHPKQTPFAKEFPLSLQQLLASHPVLSAPSSTCLRNFPGMGRPHYLKVKMVKSLKGGP